MRQYRLELHVHTKYSHDSIMPFLLLYMKCRLCGITHIAITEHNNIEGALAFRDYCRAKGNFVKVIIGEEIMTNKGEIIGLFLNTEIEPMQSPRETINAILRQKGIVYIPHPFDKKRYKTVLDEQSISDNCKYIDCIECHNGRNIANEYSIKQEEIADKYSIKKVVGSDAHTIFEVGRNFMEISIEPKNAESFRCAINSAMFRKNECLQFSHTLTKLARVVKFVQKGDIDGLYRVINKKIRRSLS